MGAVYPDRSRQYSQQAISDEWFFSKQTVNSAIQGLAHKGLISLEHAPDSRGRKLVKLTPAGEDFIEKHLIPIRLAEEKALSKMPKEDQELYVELAQKFAANFREEAESYLQSL